MNIFDLHNDLLTVNKNYIKEMNSYPSNTSVALAIYKGNLNFTKLKRLVKRYKANPHRNGYLAYEDIGYEGLDLDFIIRSKPLYVGLTHNVENQLGYGVNNNLPLKRYGVDTVKELNKNGVVLDIAHLSKKGAIDVLNNSDMVICSHTAFSSVNYHVRNLDDDIISEVITRKGIIGLTLVEFFLSNDKNGATIFDVVKHIDYFACKFSIDNLSIGTDFNGTNSLPFRLRSYSEFVNLKTELIKLGYSENDVNKILYKNAFDYFNKIAKKIQDI